MPKAQRTITHADIWPSARYAKERGDLRRALLPAKKLRRIAIGPVATAYFESFETMWLQVHEMLHIEKGGSAQIEDELSAYNPLIPQGHELVATVMFEIDDPVRRAAVLRDLTHVERTIFLDLGGERVMARAEEDVDRTAEDGKTSSIHFVRFALTPAQIARFKDPSQSVTLGIAHMNYGHMALLSPQSRAELAQDFAA